VAQKFSLFGTQCTANAAAVATSLGGGIATADVQALGALLTALSAYRVDLMYELINLTQGPGGTSLANAIIPG
jgi:hypothetical protein